MPRPVARRTGVHPARWLTALCDSQVHNELLSLGPTATNSSRRRTCLQAASLGHLCKTIMLESSAGEKVTDDVTTRHGSVHRQRTHKGSSRPITPLPKRLFFLRSKYILVVIQYTARLDESLLEAYIQSARAPPLSAALSPSPPPFPTGYQPRDAARGAGVEAREPGQALPLSPRAAGAVRETHRRAPPPPHSFLFVFFAPGAWRW